MRGVMKARPGYTLIEVIVCFFLPVTVVVVGGLGYIGYHFLSKIW